MSLPKPRVSMLEQQPEHAEHRTSFYIAVKEGIRGCDYELYLTETPTLHSQLTEMLYKLILINIGRAGKYYSQNTASNYCS